MKNNDIKTLLDMLDSSLINQIEQLTNKSISSKSSELEFIFFPQSGISNYQYLNMLKYVSYLKSRDNLEIINTDELDVSYQVKTDSENTVYRITLSGIDTINKYVNMFSKRNNHVTFKTLLDMDDKNITRMMKTKQSDDFIDITDYNIRIRLSEEQPIPTKILALLNDIDHNNMNDITFRFKRRTSLIMPVQSIKIDLTHIKMTQNINKINKKNFCIIVFLMQI